MKTYLEPEEIELLEETATNLRDRLLIRLLFHLGCRVTEVISIKVGDIDFTQSTITIVHLKRRVKVLCNNCGATIGLSYTYCPKCGEEVTRILKEHESRRQRVLPVDNQTLTLLKEYIDRGGPVMKDGVMIVIGVNRHRCWQIVRELAEKAGLPKLVNPDSGKVHGISPHKLRDAFAVHAVKLDDSGDGLRMLQEHMGHQSFNTTAKYRKVSGIELRNWFDQLWNKKNRKNGVNQ